MSDQSIVGEFARVCPASDELCARGEFRVVAVEYKWRRERGSLLRIYKGFELLVHWILVSGESRRCAAEEGQDGDGGGGGVPCFLPFHGLVISDPSDTNRDDERERSEDFSQVFFS
jgi:hypothetical protein